jgi:hypothetical protein
VSDRIYVGAHEFHLPIHDFRLAFDDRRIDRKTQGLAFEEIS